MLPIIGALFVGPMIHYLAREAKGHGVPEVLEALVFKNGVIRPIVAAVKITASAITIGFGGSVGREGPIVQIGAAMASTVGQFLHFSPQRLRTMIGCGAAAGIAATFNAPIAGTFFALEILLRDFAVVTFSPIVVASVVATTVSRHYLGDTPAFPVPGFEMNSPVELPLYLVMGLVVGAVALIYVRTLYFTEDAFDRLRFPEALKPALGAIPLGVLFLWFPQVYGVGYGSMVHALEGNMDLTLMALLIVVKLVAVCLTLGSGSSGGIFAPALFLGGMTGGACGALFNVIWPGLDVPVGAFAMVGMAAMVGAATGGPLTAMIILFEMTGEYRVMLPLMLASVTATLGYRSVLRDSIFTLKFTRQGRRLEFGRESAILKQYHASDIMIANPVTIRNDAPFEDILKLFLETNEEHYYVVDDDGRLAGRITIHDVKDILHEESLGQVLIAADLTEPVASVVYRTDNLEDCLIRLGDLDGRDLPVLASPDRPVLVGVVTRQAIFEVYNREVLHQEDMGIKLVHGEARMRDCVDLPEAYKVQMFTPPADWLGMTLRDLELRPRFGVTVLAVKHRRWLGGSENELPRPDHPLDPGDRLIIVGRTDDLDRLLEHAREGRRPGVPPSA
jgi:CIC family chloride channel protein